MAFVPPGTPRSNPFANQLHLKYLTSQVLLEARLKETIMITLRRASERGGGDYGWLNTKHTLSFSDY